MEKVVCALWRNPDEAREAFNARLLAGLPEALRGAGARQIRLNLRDAAVDPAEGLVQQWQSPQQDAVVQYWLPSANALFRGPAEAALAAHCQRFAAWLVAESTILANPDHPPQPGERTRGWAQASFLAFRPDVSRGAAMAHWHGHHTRIAVATQANFEYVQNPLICALTADAPGYDAFVEECFPPGAMTDPAAFFAADGDAARLRANREAMMASCAQFIDFSRIDILPTSQFDFA